MLRDYFITFGSWQCAMMTLEIFVTSFISTLFKVSMHLFVSGFSHHNQGETFWEEPLDSLIPVLFLQIYCDPVPCYLTIHWKKTIFIKFSLIFIICILWNLYGEENWCLLPTSVPVITIEACTVKQSAILETDVATYLAALSQDNQRSWSVYLPT